MTAISPPRPINRQKAQQVLPQLLGSQGTTRHFRQVAAMQWEVRALPGTAGQLSPFPLPILSLISSDMSKAMYPGRYMALMLSVWNEGHIVKRGYNAELPAGTGLKEEKQLSGVEVSNTTVCFTLREAAAEPVDHATDPNRLPREKNLQAGFVEHPVH